MQWLGHIPEFTLNNILGNATHHLWQFKQNLSFKRFKTTPKNHATMTKEADSFTAYTITHIAEF